VFGWMAMRDCTLKGLHYDYWGKGGGSGYSSSSSSSSGS